jgi:hypothetical protein
MRHDPDRAANPGRWIRRRPTYRAEPAAMRGAASGIRAWSAGRRVS